jgi:hypothetical protein
MITMSTLATEPRLLSETDRCDRCGARAYVVAVFDAGHLAFCAHHGRQYSHALAATAVLVHDESTWSRTR